MNDSQLSEWPVISEGWRATPSSLICGYCRYGFIESSGEWNEPDDPEVTMGELMRRIEAHATECPKRPS